MESYQRLIDIISLQNLQMQAEHWVLTRFLIESTLLQIATLVAAGVLAFVGTFLMRPQIRRAQMRLDRRRLTRGLGSALWSLTGTLIALTLVLIAAFAARMAGLPDGLLSIAAKLLAAWIVVRLLSQVIRNEFWSRFAFFVAFFIASAHLLGFLEGLIIQLDQIGFSLGSIRLSVLDLLSGIARLALFIWIALVIAQLGENYIQSSRNMSASLRVLIGKLLRMGLVSLALIIALASIGIDITAFALVTGAFGVALGFGMQKTVSNLLSGMLLLVDRSIKPGDVLELSDPADRTVQLFGWVTSLNARYVSLTTRDGTEWLVPNDELISQRIVNWSYSHKRLRLLTPIAIDFDCDVRQAMALAEAGAGASSRVLRDPAPVCRLMSFGDSCVNLELRFWIEDPTNGIINVRSEVLLAVWDQFRAHGIRTRLGHRDLHIKDGSELTVRMDRGGQA